MNPALTTRSGRCSATALARAASQAARSAKSFDPQVERGHACALRPGEALDAGPVRADAHHARRVLGSTAASSNACSSVPDPDTSTTTRAGTGTSTR